MTVGGGDDYDDDWSNDKKSQDEGEEPMDLENRISFNKIYSEAQKAIIDAKTNAIAKELSGFNIGVSAFRLNKEVLCIYSNNTFSFEYKEGNHWRDTNDYCSKVLLISQWEEIKKDIVEQKTFFDHAEKEALSIIEHTRDNLAVILAAYKNGLEIDMGKLNEIIELEDLSDAEKELFIRHGFGFDLYDEVGYRLQDSIARQLGKSAPFYLRSEDLSTWIFENPEKCLLPENRTRRFPITM